MAELRFKILAGFLEYQYGGVDEVNLKIQITNLKKYVQNCGLSITTIDVAKVNKSDDVNYPEMEEFVVDVQARNCSVSTHRGKTFLYKELRKQWQELSQNLDGRNRPMLVLHEKDSFTNTRDSCHIEVPCTGISFGTIPMCSLYLEYASLSSILSLDFYHDIRSIEVKYSWHYMEHNMVIAYSNIRKCFVSSGKSCELFLDLFHPPLFYMVERKRARNGVSYTINHRVISTGIDVSIIGKANVICLKISNPNQAEEIVGRLHFRCAQMPVNYANIVSQYKMAPIIPRVELPHFGCTYILTAIFNRNFVVIEQTSNIKQSICVLQNYSVTNGDCLEKALISVLSAIDSGKTINYWSAIEKLYQYYINNRDEVNYNHYIIPARSRSIRRVMITPTRLLFWPPETMCENRVLRNFDADFALRVNFRDDNVSRLSWNALYASNDIFISAITTPMTNGILIGSRLFEFLAWSNSQIRDHGVWMYAKDNNGTTVTDIREWMGDFSHINTVPKYMARMGQCFSQTEDTISVPLSENHIRTEKDIEHGLDPMNLKPYCFSDGVGKISTKLARKVHDALGHDKLCSAFQVRYGGYKGMLVIDPTLTDTDIVFRQSMKKFDSPQNTRLEIARTSAPSSLQLNRPFVTLLNDMGVRHATFLQLQENILRLLTDMLLDEEKAVIYLKSKTPSGLYKYRDLSASGVTLTTEPFFRSLLLALHRHHVENIKTRANISIDPDKGRNMLGVLDETGLLNYGEVFVQYTIDASAGETTKDTNILKGEVLVTKNPCTHPGDVRKFRAVDITQLHHITDCIVFPQKGCRPHPNEMAGSDLDGDEYTVLWSKELIFHRENYIPAHYPSVSAPVVSNITVKDMIAFLVEYIKNDQVGVIANAHLAQADVSDIFSAKCISIAKKFSIAVDFAKNGSSENLNINERPENFPDFMEKSYKLTYNSKKALGKMFRVCKDFESENVQASIAYDIKVDPHLVYSGWKDYEEDAIKSRNKYNRLLNTVLQTYGIQHEAEAFSGAFTHLHCRYQERKDKAEIEKVVIGCIKALSKNMLSEFLEEFSSSNVTDVTKLLQKASAWYLVTYSQPQATFLSFAWIVSKYLANIRLLNIANAKPGIDVNPLSPIVLEMDTIVIKSSAAGLLPSLPYITINLMKQYNFLCPRNLVENALSVLILWAQDQGIIEVPGQNRQGLLFLDVFLKLILHVAELEHYICKSNSKESVIKTKHFSPSTLCLDFLRYCVTLRFYNKYKVAEILPFNVYNYKKLSKRAMVTYHGFALSGQFPSLQFEPEFSEDSFEMKPVHIENRIFPSVPIPEADLIKAENALVRYSNVKYVKLREIHQIKKVMVCAEGTESTVKILKSLLRKKHIFLRQLFTTGILPE